MNSPFSSAQQARRELGQRLREIRRDAGLTARSLAVATGQHYTRVSKLENGVQSPTYADIRAWCRACGSDGQVPDLIATAHAIESAYLEFQRQSRAGMKRVVGPHTPSLYDRTMLYRIYEHNVIPGLFQTREYTAAMLSFWIDFLGTPNDLNEAVASRLERQTVIYRPDRRFAVVLEEQALRTWFGTAETQAGQLNRLLTIMSLPNVSVGFWIFDDSLVALETPTASIEVSRPNEIRLYVRMFEELRRAAVYGDGARSRVYRTLAELT